MKRLGRRGQAEWLIVACGSWHIGVGHNPSRCLIRARPTRCQTRGTPPNMSAVPTADRCAAPQRRAAPAAKAPHGTVSTPSQSN
jgi:hypothetical protein